MPFSSGTLRVRRFPGTLGDASGGASGNRRIDDWEKEILIPTVLRTGCYRFYFLSNEGQEPVHIHVKAGNDPAKYWLYPIELASDYGFRAHELNEIGQMVEQHQVELMEAWDEYFG